MANVVKVTIEIETTNAAFEEARESGSFAQEFNYVLDQAKLIDGHKLLDANGNTVGTVKVETE